MFLGIGLGLDSCNKIHEPDEDDPVAAKFWPSAISCDSAIAITALIVGILGAVGVLHGLPPAASYSLMGAGVLIPLAWIITNRVLKNKIAEYVFQSIDTLKNL